MSSRTTCHLPRRRAGPTLGGGSRCNKRTRLLAANLEGAAACTGAAGRSNPRIIFCWCCCCPKIFQQRGASVPGGKHTGCSRCACCNATNRTACCFSAAPSCHSAPTLAAHSQARLPRRHGSAAGCVPKTAAAVGILSWHTTCCRLQGADAAAACTTAVESSIPRIISRWCWCCCPKIFKHVHHLCRLAGHLRLCGLFARGESELFATAAHTAVRRIAPLAAASPLRRVILRRCPAGCMLCAQLPLDSQV